MPPMTWDNMSAFWGTFTLWKAIALGALVFGISAWYSFKTRGRDFWDDFNSRDQSTDQERSGQARD